MRFALSKRINDLVHNMHHLSGKDGTPLNGTPPAEYSTVQGLVRGLSVLLALNREPNATASVIMLAGLTGLHRTTVKRLLETLRIAGFVRHLPESNSYRLAFRVQQLSEGFRDEVWVCDIARPLVRGLTERILWPGSVVTLEKDYLVVRESTHQFSPLSFHSGVLGASIPLMRTAAGRAYLAFCDPAERELLLEMVRSHEGTEGRLANDRAQVASILETTRARGYAINEGDWIGKGRFGAIAVPIRHKRRILGCLDVVFSKRAITVDEAVHRYVPDILATARAIEKGAASLPLSAAF